jgi:PadR family transcriptional regulator, regulatory protein PadR
MRRHFGEFEQSLLYSVIHLQEKEAGASGPAIQKLLRERTGRLVSPGAIYTALARLEERGLVKSELGEPTPERGGKRKRLYEVRAAGEAALKSAESNLARLAKLAGARGQGK